MLSGTDEGASCSSLTHFGCAGLASTDAVVVDSDVDYICPPCQAARYISIPSNYDLALTTAPAFVVGVVSHPLLPAIGVPDQPSSRYPSEKTDRGETQVLPTGLQSSIILR